MQHSTSRSVNNLLRRSALACTMISVVAGAGAAKAQDMEIPVSTQISLFLKVLEFDRRLGETVNGVLTIGVVFQSGSRQSTAARDDAVRSIAQLAADGERQIRVVDVDVDRDDWRSATAVHRMDMLYVTPLRGAPIMDICATARAVGATTFTGVPKYVEQGIAVGVRRLGNRPKLLVNLRVARLEGADFSAELLKLAQVVK